MASVFASEERVAPLVAPFADRLALAAINAPDGVVLSGSLSALDSVLASLASEGIKSRRLSVSHAFHSPLLDPMLAEFERHAREVHFAVPTLPIVSNVSGDFVRDGVMSLADYWAEQIRRPVRFASGVQALERAGATVFLEIGPAATLIGLAQRSLPEGSGLFLPSLRKGRGEFQQLFESVAALYLHGVDLDWRGFGRPWGGRKIALPTYPFQRKRFWVEGEVLAIDFASTASSRPTGSDAGILGREVAEWAAAPSTRIFEAEVDTERLPFVEDHRIGGMTLAPMALFLELATAAAARVFGAGDHELETVELHKPLLLSATQRRRLQVSVESRPEGKLDFSAWSRGVEARGAAGPWTLHATAQIARAAQISEPRREEVVS